MPQIPLSYRYRIERRADGYHYRFPELPEADFAAATTAEGAAEMSGRITAALAARIKVGRLPKERRAHAGEGVARVLPSLAAKLLFVAKSEESGAYPAEIARRLDITSQEAQRLYRLEHTTKIDAVNAALAALGWRLTLGVEPIETDSKKAAPEE